MVVEMVVVTAEVGKGEVDSVVEMEEVETVVD